jgi:hypothetical protein
MTTEHIIDFEDADPFEPTPAPAPKKRGRPAASKPKPATKPRFRLLGMDTGEIVEKLSEIAWLIDPQCRSSKAAQVRVAAELLELIENKKA